MNFEENNIKFFRTPEITEFIDGRIFEADKELILTEDEKSKIKNFFSFFLFTFFRIVRYGKFRKIKE